MSKGIANLAGAEADATTVGAGRGRLRPSHANPSGGPPPPPIFSPVQALVCRNCGGIVVFEADGWRHRDIGRFCPVLVVAWPPPSESEDD